MPEQNQELLYALLVGCMVFLVLAGFIILLIYLHKQKSRRMNTERELLTAQYQQQMLQSQLEVEEQTRNNIALDLHDNIGALSSLIKINLGLYSTESSTTRKEQIIHESRDLTRQLTTEIKELALRLNTERISQLLFSEIMQVETDRLKKLQLFNVSFEVAGEEYVLDAHNQIMIYRICQEILNNSLKHSKAKNVMVKLQFLPAALDIIILDDGVGISTPVQKMDGNLGGSGIINLKNRIRLLNGNLELHSEPGKGTKYIISIPTQPIEHVK